MITARYLLIALPPIYQDASGAVWLDRVWHRDLIRHLDYIQDLTVASVCHPLPPNGHIDGQDLIRVAPEWRDRLHFIPLRPIRSRLQIPINILRNAAKFWRLIQGFDIVHSGIAGWPYPLGALVNPIAKLQGKALIIVIESSTWRITDPHGVSWLKKQRARFWEWLARQSVHHADLAIFTSPGYQDTLGAPKAGQLLITPANWVDESIILPRDRAKSRWAARRGPVRFVCPTRLEPYKGVGCLLQAIAWLEAHQIRAHVDIIGQGSMREQVRRSVQDLRHVTSRLMAPVPYGAPFFTLLHDYDAVIAPTLGDEQPRVIFDAYSQALPVIAANTSGQDFIVQDGQTGVLFPAGDGADLAQKIDSLGQHRPILQDMGLRALTLAARQTHDRMHALRRQAILDMLAKKYPGRQFRR